jgi:hypothetical protein
MCMTPNATFVKQVYTSKPLVGGRCENQMGTSVTSFMPRLEYLVIVIESISLETKL